MKITLVKIGRLAYPEYRFMGQLFFSRLQPKSSFEVVELKDDQQGLKYLLAQKAGGSLVWTLEEQGEKLSSLELSHALSELRDKRVTKQLVFVVGHPLGIPDQIKQLSKRSLSLSPLTLTSDLAFVVLCEQIYRAFEILKGSGYHHGST